MTIAQADVQTLTGVSIQASESMIFIITGANHMELNRVDTVVHSCGFVNADLSGWRNFGHFHGPVQYIVVFKRIAHVGQHKTRLIELIKEEIPGVTITTI